VKSDLNQFYRCDCDFSRCRRKIEVHFLPHLDINHKQSANQSAYRTMSKVIIVLPANGEPYVWKGKVYEKKDEINDELPLILNSVFTDGNKELLRVISENKKSRWGLIGELLSNKKHLSKMELYMQGNTCACCDAMCNNLAERLAYSKDLALVVPVCVFDDKISLKMFNQPEMAQQILQRDKSKYAVFTFSNSPQVQQKAKQYEKRLNKQ